MALVKFVKSHLAYNPPPSRALLAVVKWQRVSWRRGTKGRPHCEKLLVDPGEPKLPKQR